MLACLYELGQYHENIRYLDEALQIDPNFSLGLIGKGAALYQLGKIYLDRETLDESIRYFDKALDIDPNTKSASDFKYSVENAIILDLKCGKDSR